MTKRHWPNVSKYSFKNPESCNTDSTRVFEMMHSFKTKLSLQDSDQHFNHTIVVDIIYIEHGEPKPILHIVDEATSFQAARWLKDISAQNVWNNLQACWIDTYLRLPDIVRHDAGMQFMSNEFKELENSMAISTEPVTVETHNSVGLVEQYHFPLLLAHNIISEELKGSGCGVNKDLVLQMVPKAIITLRDQMASFPISFFWGLPATFKI